MRWRVIVLICILMVVALALALGLLGWFFCQKANVFFEERYYRFQVGLEGMEAAWATKRDCPIGLPKPKPRREKEKNLSLLGVPFIIDLRRISFSRFLRNRILEDLLE